MIVVLRWWFFFWASSIVLTLATATGYMTKLWHADISHISVGALGLYFLTSVFIGHLTVIANRGNVKSARSHAPACWFIAELMLALGMAGTLIGFLIILGTAFINFNPANSGAAQQVLAAAANGLSTAGLSTLVGLVCSFLIKAQLVNLEYLTERS